MAKTIIRAHMKQRRDTAVNWQAQNPILLAGEIGIVTDQPDRYKVGDGVTEWNALPLRGFDGNIVQMTGGSRTAVMSQWAVTQAIEGVENNMLKSEDLTAATKDLASKTELSEAIEDVESRMLTLDKLEEVTKDLASKAELSEAIEALTAEVITNEEVTAAALNDLNTQITALNRNVTGETATKMELAESLAVLDTSIKAEIIANEEVIAAALNDLNARIDEINTRLAALAI